MGEPELIHAAIPAGAEILELGAGAGRMTHPLIALGHPVVAVDQSAEMLGHISGAEKVVADIETLALGRRFPVVVLASNFASEAGAERRRTFLGCCALHTAPDGRVLLQRLPPGWEPKTDWILLGDVHARLREFTQDGTQIEGEMEYVLGDRRVFHRFASELLSDEALDRELRAVDLCLSRVLGERREWVEAVPST